MNIPIVAFDRRNNAGFIKSWQHFFPKGYLKKDRDVKTKIQGENDINSLTRGSARTHGFILCYCHSSWFDEQSKRSLDVLAKVFSGTDGSGMAHVFVVFVSEGGIERDSEENQRVGKLLGVIQNFYWTVSRLNFPSGGGIPNAKIVESFEEHLAKKLHALAVAKDVVNPQEEFRRLFAEYENVVDPPPCGVRPSQEQLGQVQSFGFTDGLAFEDHCFRLFVLIKLHKLLGWPAEGAAIHALRRKIVMCFPKEELSRRYPQTSNLIEGWASVDAYPEAVRNQFIAGQEELSAVLRQVACPEAKD